MSSVENYLKKRRKRFFVVVALLASAFIASFLIHLSTGAVLLNPAETFSRGIQQVITHTSGIERYRLQRAFAAAAVGSALALSGFLIQASARNPLGDPYLLGISSGALFAVVLTFALPPTIIASMMIRPLAALAGGLIAYGATLYIASKAGMTPTSLVLSGVAVGTFLYSASLLPQYFIIQDIHRVFAWSQGSLIATSLAEPTAILLALTASVIYVAKESAVLNALSISDDFVKDLGKDPASLRKHLTFVAALLASLTVAWFGIIGFVGLASPHAARRLLKTGDAKLVLPASLLVGASILTLSDAAAKTLFYPMDIPVNILVSMIGAPALAAILVGMRKHA